MSDYSPTSSYNRTDRAGLKTVVAFVDPELSRHIKIIAADTRSNVQIIAENALVQAVRKHWTDAGDKKKLAELKAAVERMNARRSGSEVSAPSQTKTVRA